MSLIAVYNSGSKLLSASNLVGSSAASCGSLSVTSGATIGTAYAGSAAPANSLLVSGNVGIGTTMPQAPLHIQVDASGTTTNARVVRDFIDTSGNYTYLSTTNKVGSGVVVAPAEVTPGSGEGAIYIPGTTTDYISLPNGSAAGIDEVLFNADFTMETWVYYIAYPTNTSAGGSGRPTLIGNMVLGSIVWSFGVTYQGYLAFNWYASATTNDQNILTQSVVPRNKWTHIAIKYVASTKVLNMYINGVVQNLNFAFASATYVTGTTGTSTATLTASAVLLANTVGVSIGCYPDSGYTNTCYISNLRFTYGAGTNPWTTPSLSLPLTNVTGTKILIRVGQSTAQNYGPLVPAPLMTLGATNMSFYDASGNYDQLPQAMSTGNVVGSTFSPGSGEGSVYFGGSGSYLSFSPGYAANIADILAQDFTIEAWVNYTATQPSYGTAYISTLIMNGALASANGRWAFGGNTNNTLSFYIYNGANTYVETSATISLNTWTHIAVSFIKSTKAMQLFINGVAQIIGAGAGITGTGTTTATITTASVTTDTTNKLLINTANSVGSTVYVSNMRLTSGGNPWVTPSLTLPLASTANTKLLLRADTTQALAPMYPPQGSAPLYAARAWVNFNGTTSVKIRGNGNIASITRLGTGRYQIYFTNSMPDANYCGTGSAGDITITYGDRQVSIYPVTADYCIAVTGVTASSTVYDSAVINVAIFR